MAGNLTARARQEKIDPVIGRDEEIRRVMQVLSRRTKHNPLLIGEPGVGKTAIAEGLARRVVAVDVPDSLKNKRLISMDLRGRVTGAKFRGDFEERLKAFLKEVTSGEGQITSCSSTNCTPSSARASRIADSLMVKVRAVRKAIRTVTVKARYRHLDEDQRSESLPEPNDLETDIYPRLRPLLKQAWKRKAGLRLVGLRLSNVHDSCRQEELPLLGAAPSSVAQRALTRAVDDLRRTLGHDTNMRGHDLRLKKEG